MNKGGKIGKGTSEITGSKIERIIKKYIPHRDFIYVPDLVKELESHAKENYIKRDVKLPNIEIEVKRFEKNIEKLLHESSEFGVKVIPKDLIGDIIFYFREVLKNI